MGQANELCLICTRFPGEVHAEDCPRNMRNVKSRQRAVEIMSKPRVFYPQKGAAVASFKDELGELHVLRNRGLPYVNTARNGKPFTAGGLPSEKGVRITAEELIIESDFFAAGIKAEMGRPQPPVSDDQIPPDAQEFDEEIVQQALVVGAEPATVLAAVLGAAKRSQPVVIRGDNGTFAVTPEGGFTEVSPTGRTLPKPQLQEFPRGKE